MKQVGQVVEAIGNIWMIYTERIFRNRESTSIQMFRIDGAICGLEQTGQVVEAVSDL